MNNANEVIKRSSKIYRDFTNKIDWQIKVHPIIKITATCVKHRWEKAFRVQRFERISLFSASRRLSKVSRGAWNQIKLSTYDHLSFICYLGYGRNNCANTLEQDPLVAVSNFPLFELVNKVKLLLKKSARFEFASPTILTTTFIAHFSESPKGQKIHRSHALFSQTSKLKSSPPCQSTHLSSKKSFLEHVKRDLQTPYLVVCKSVKDFLSRESCRLRDFLNKEVALPFLQTFP